MFPIIRKGKNFWEKGSSEIIGFLCILPTLLFLFFFLISISQLGSIREKLEYTTYVACRAAVASKDFESAQAAAYSTAENNLIGFTDTFDPESLSVELTVINSENSRPAGSERRAEELWEKGNYVSCTVSIEAKTLLSIVSGEKTSSLTMMIESPANSYEEIFEP